MNVAARPGREGLNRLDQPLHLIEVDGLVQPGPTGGGRDVAVCVHLVRWGIDVEKFEERAKESFESARGDLTEITGTLRHTLVKAKDIVVGLQKNGAPVAAEIKTGFERAWHKI